MDIEARMREIAEEVFDKRTRDAAKADPDQIMTAPQAAEEIGMTTNAVAKWCRTGLIRPAIRRGHWRFTRAAFDAFLSGRSTRKVAA